MAMAADAAGIQFRTLNASKGPAVRATRAQADRQLYKRAMRRLLETQPNLQLFQQEVADLRLRQGQGRRLRHVERHRVRRAQPWCSPSARFSAAAFTSASKAMPAAAPATRPRSRSPRGCASCRSRSAG